MAKKTYIVTKPNCYMSVDKKLTELSVGSELSVDENHKFVKNGSFKAKDSGKKVKVDSDK